MKINWKCCLFAAIVGLLIAFLPLTASARARDSSMRTTPGGLNLGDLNGDGMHDWVGIQNSDPSHIRIYIGSNADWPIDFMQGGKILPPIGMNLDPRYTFVGRFTSKVRDAVCVVYFYYDPDSGSGKPSLECFDYLPTSTGYSLFDFDWLGDGDVGGNMIWELPFARNNSSESQGFAIGDFDGDGYDEVVTYNRNNGTNIKFWRYDYGSKLFVANTKIDIGNMAGFNWPGGVDILVGNITGLDSDGVKRDDILVHNRTTHQLIGYSSSWWAGKQVFWWMYTKNCSAIGAANYSLSLANVDGGGQESLVAMDLGGHLKFLNVVDWSNVCAPLPNVVQGNVYQDPSYSPGGAFAYPIWVSTSNTRDDVFVSLSDGGIHSYFPVDSAGQKTYWWRGWYTAGYVKSRIGM